MGERAGRGASPLPWVAAFWSALYAAFVVVGADTYWAVVLGRRAAETGDLTPALPYAAEVGVWHGPLTLGGGVLALADHAAPWGVAALHVVIVCLALTMVEVALARSGVAFGERAVRLSAVAVGAAGAFGVARLPSLSILPFLVIAGLLRQDHVASGRRVWLVVVVLALWANLHGGFVIGVALVGAWAVVEAVLGRRPRRLLVLLAGVLALLASPQGWGIVPYVRGVFANEAAARHTDLWARPSLTHPLDLALLVAALVLVLLVVRRRPPLWELVVIVGLVVGTLLAARNGLWLLLFAAGSVPEARGSLSVGQQAPGPTRRVLLFSAAVLLGLVAAVASRGAAAAAPGHDQVERLRSLLTGHVVLADEPLTETLLAHDVRVWAGNPIDAFPAPSQRAYLDFLHGDGTVGIPQEVSRAVVRDGSSAQAALHTGWRRVTTVSPYVVYERVS